MQKSNNHYNLNSIGADKMIHFKVFAGKNRSAACDGVVVVRLYKNN